MPGVINPPPLVAGEPLPRFEETAAVCRELGLLANIEIKPADGFERTTGELVARKILELWRGASLPLVSSFSEIALQATRQVAPQMPLGCLYKKPPSDWLERFDALNSYSLHCSFDALEDSVLCVANARSVPVLCWTVNDRILAKELFRRGVTSVFSDQVDVLAGL